MATTLLVTAGLTALSIGASYIAARLNKPKEPKPLKDDRQPVLATKGSMLPLVMGARKVAPIVAWDGDLKTTKEESGGGKGFGGDSQTTGYKYAKGGWHLLCLGEGTLLGQVWRNGKPLLDAPIDAAATPSGSKIKTKKGSFFIYWGSLSQPVATKLGDASRVGVASQWPGVMSVYWDRAQLGTSPYWPTFEYEVFVPISDGGLGGTPMFLSGCNPGHALWRLLTAPSPFGLGVPSDQIDAAAVKRLCTLCETEGLGVNILARDGQKASEVVSQLLSEVGFMLPQIGDLITPMPIRPAAVGDPVPMLNPSMLVDPDPEVRQQHGDTTPTRKVFLIYDRAFNYRSNDVPLDSDATARQWGGQRPDDEQLQDVTDMEVGKKIALRRQAEDAADGITYTLSVTRAARTIQPGQLFDHPTLGRLRCSSRQPLFDSTRATIEALVDQYGDGLRTGLPPDSGGGAGGGFAADPDSHVRIMALPAALTGGDAVVGIARIRANPGITGAAVLLSPDGTTYRQVGTQDPYAAGGTLNAGILATDHDGTNLLASGPTITAWNEDIDDVLDLTGNDAEWQAGTQLCIIDDEWMYLRRVLATGGGYQLLDLQRGVYGTTIANHAAGADVWIVRPDQTTPFSGGAVAHGATVYAKTVPHTADDSVDPAAVAAVSVAVP